MGSSELVKSGSITKQLRVLHLFGCSDASSDFLNSLTSLSGGVVDCKLDVFPIVFGDLDIESNRKEILVAISRHVYHFVLVTPPESNAGESCNVHK